MRWFRRDTSDIGNDHDDPPAYCRKLIQGFRAKADHNKTESQAAFIAVVAATLLSTLFITLGAGYWLGKVIPALLSLLAAGATSWLQLRKPQRLWTLYRGCQRALEDEDVRYRYGLPPYDVDAGKEKLLAESCSKIAMDAHKKWEGLVPDVGALSIGPGQGGGRHGEQTGAS
jgi:hypothetical protein